MLELDKEDVKSYMKYGRRNISNLTIPPSGSLSILAKITSGIEPVFAISYKRRRKVDSGNIVFVDKNGDKWEEYRVFHPKFLEWYQSTADGLSSLDDAKNALNGASDALFAKIVALSPYNKASANEIDPKFKIRLQGTIQKYIDHSISNTINLPKETTKEEVDAFFNLAWESGCKGITIYREGSRDGVLISNKTTNGRKFQQYHAPKRPKILRAEANSATVRGDKFTVIVGLFEDKPYEVFAYRGNGLSGSGELIKKKKGDYYFKQETIEENITNDLTDEQEALTRAISYGLRHGGDVMFAVEQLNKTKGDLSSFSKAMARVLKKSIEDGKSARAKCEKCGNDLKYEDGCVSCTCGFSKC